MSERSQFFRAGVGIAVINSDGHLLVLKRADVSKAAWQLPQGGLEPGEAPKEAMWRELDEEAGLDQNNCVLVATSDKWHAYELPKPYRSGKVGRGQVQRWYVCRLTGSDDAIRPDGREFDDWRWTTAEALLDEVAPFRRPVYEAVFAEFAEFLS